MRFQSRKFDVGQMMPLWCFCLILASLVFVAPVIYGADDGRVVGTVTTDSSGQSPVKATISITLNDIAREFTTDDRGYYLIPSVPPGTYHLTVAAEGYQTVVVPDVVVFAGHVTNRNAVLASEAVSDSTTAEVTAGKKAVMRGCSGTETVIEADDITTAPVRKLEEFIGAQSSVVEVPTGAFQTYQRATGPDEVNAPELHVLGGDYYHHDIRVNGMSFRNAISGRYTGTIAPLAIHEIDFNPGSLPAQYGEALTGMTNVVTKAGGSRYSGTFEAVTDNGIGTGYDQNWYSATLSGPVTSLKGAFFAGTIERRWLGDRNPSSLTDDPLPANWQSGWSYHGRIDYRFVPKALLTLTADGSVDKWQSYLHWYNNPVYPTQVNHSPRYEDKNLGLSASLVYELSKKLTGRLQGSYFVSERTRGDGVVFDNLAAYDRDLANPQWDYYYLFREGDSLFASDLDPVIIPGSPQDTFVTVYESYWGNYQHYKASYSALSASATYDFNPRASLTIGGDYKRHTLRYYENLNATLGYSSYRVNRYGYDSLGNESDNESWENDTKHPINLGLFAETRLKFGQVTIQYGVRVDFRDYDGEWFVDPLNPLDPDGTGIYTLDSTDVSAVDNEWRQTRRAAVTVPAGDNTQFCFVYDTRSQTVPFRFMYTGWDFVEARLYSGGDFSFGNPSMVAEWNRTYEFGVSQQLGSVANLEAIWSINSVRDIVSSYHASTATPSGYYYLANHDELDYRGLQVRAEVRPLRRTKLDLAYTLSWTDGGRSYYNASYNIFWKNATYVAPTFEDPAYWDQRHKLIGTFDFATGKGEGPIMGNIHPLENLRCVAMIRFAAGTPYTPTTVYNEASVPASVFVLPTAPVNSANMPSTFSIDLKLERQFKIGSVTVAPFLWIRNLLDRDNVVGVYTGTGEADYCGYLDSPDGIARSLDQGEEFVSRYETMEANPQNYDIPRLIYFGLKAGF